jgi:hypothetical protein
MLTSKVSVSRFQDIEVQPQFSNNQVFFYYVLTLRTVSSLLGKNYVGKFMEGIVLQKLR